jgi:formylglycine-generating enzyme required for sulfatase activity
VLFSVWETRVNDYQAFCDATKRSWEKPTFPQTSDHPAVKVSWEDATAFIGCQRIMSGVARWGSEIERMLPQHQ